MIAENHRCRVTAVTRYSDPEDPRKGIVNEVLLLPINRARSRPTEELPAQTRPRIGGYLQEQGHYAPDAELQSWIANLGGDPSQTWRSARELGEALTKLLDTQQNAEKRRKEKA